MKLKTAMEWRSVISKSLTGVSSNTIHEADILEPLIKDIQIDILKFAAEIAKKYEPDERASFVTYASDEILSIVAKLETEEPIV